MTDGPIPDLGFLDLPQFLPDWGVRYEPTMNLYWIGRGEWVEKRKKRTWVWTDVYAVTVEVLEYAISKRAVWKAATREVVEQTGHEILRTWRTPHPPPIMVISDEWRRLRPVMPFLEHVGY